MLTVRAVCARRVRFAACRHRDECVTELPVAGESPMKPIFLITVFVVFLQAVPSKVFCQSSDQKIRGLLYNEDSTDFFAHRVIPAGKSAEILNQYIDVLANAKISALFCNINSRRTNSRSGAWASYWDGYDPNGGDDQPFLQPIPSGPERKLWQMLVHNAWQVHQDGVDYPAHVINRCRERGIAPWISIRMNDVHFNNNLEHPFHDVIFRKSELFRKNDPGYFARCLDYAHAEVREHYRKLIAEVVDRYDVDGIELDFLREPYLFSAGEEQTGASVLTEWLREIRQLTEKATALRGHPVRLSVRVPSEPEVALGLGIDAPTWVKFGLIDLVVVSPRWRTIHFDLPIQEWRRLLGDRVSLAGGLEVNYQPEPSKPARPVTPEEAVGAALAVWSAGADAVYLFNYFQNSHPRWSPDVYQQTISACGSPERLKQMPRVHSVTERDIFVPGKARRIRLPVTGSSVSFKLPLGPRPPIDWKTEVTVRFADPTPPQGTLKVTVNGTLGTPITDRPVNADMALFSLPPSAVIGDGTDTIVVTSTDQKEMKIILLEVRLAPEK